MKKDKVETITVSHRNINRKIYKDFKAVARDQDLAIQEAVELAYRAFIKKGNTSKS